MDMTNTPLAHPPRQAARTLGIGLTALYDEIGAGRIKVKKYGRRTLITTSELKAWLDALPASERKVA